MSCFLTGCMRWNTLCRLNERRSHIFCEHLHLITVHGRKLPLGVCSRILPWQVFPLLVKFLQSPQLDSWCSRRHKHILHVSQTLCSVCLSACSMGEVITAVLDLAKRSRQATLWKCQCICHLQRKRSLIWASVTKTRTETWRSQDVGLQHL